MSQEAGSLREQDSILAYVILRAFFAGTPETSGGARQG